MQGVHSAKCLPAVESQKSTDLDKVPSTTPSKDGAAAGMPNYSVY